MNTTSYLMLIFVGIAVIFGTLYLDKLYENPTQIIRETNNITVIYVHQNTQENGLENNVSSYDNPISVQPVSYQKLSAPHGCVSCGFYEGNRELKIYDRCYKNVYVYSENANLSTLTTLKQQWLKQGNTGLMDSCLFCAEQKEIWCGVKE